MKGLNSIKPDLRDEGGAVMLLTIMLMVVFSLLTVTLYELLKVSTQISGNHRLDVRTIYVADAGVEDAINALRADPGIDNDANYEFTGTLTDGTYSVVVEDCERTGMSIYDEADITSTGTLSNYQRKIKAHVKIILIDSAGVFAVSTTSWELLPIGS